MTRFVAVCNTVAYAHSKGIVHRDLKPANIMLGDYGETLVVDWGLAKRMSQASEPGPAGAAGFSEGTEESSQRTATGAALGTPAFMSPEQAAGLQDLVGPSSDIYGLGATLYALVTGQPPISGSGMQEVLHRVQRGEFPPPRKLRPEVPRALEAICLKAMAYEPAARYATALELAADLERWLADEPVGAYREPLAARARRWVRRHRTAFTALAVLVTTALVVGVIGVLFAGREQARARALGQVEALRDAAAPAVPILLAKLNLADAGVLPRLRELWQQENLPERQRRRVGLALLPADSGAVRARLMAMMLEADDPEEMLLLRDTLRPYAAPSSAGLWAEARRPAKDTARHFRVLVALAAFDADSTNWPDVAEPLVEQLLTSNPLQRGIWTGALRPIRRALLPPLAKAVTRYRATEKGLLAATILADYAAGQRTFLIEALLQASPDQYAALWPKLGAYRDTLLDTMKKELRPLPEDAEPAAALDAQASRQASAAVTLVKLGHGTDVWPLLRSGRAPRLRSYLIHRFAALRADPEGLLKQFRSEKDASVRQALLLSLGEYRGDQLPAEIRQGLQASLLPVYRADPDPGIHAAAEWLLRRLGSGDAVRAADKELISPGPVQSRRWYLSREGHCLVVIPAGLEFPMRAPPTRDDPAAPEVLKPRRLARAFAIATKEVTLEQFRRFLRDNPDVARDYVFNPRVSPDAKGPATQVTWLHAARYCRWLSDLEHIPDREMCFPPIKDIKEGMHLPADFARRTGYRLPTQEEWECACRTGTVTSRAYGSADELLKYYAWYFDNSQKRVWPVGLLKPNDWGLFDLYGNVYEWCMDEVRFSPEVEEHIYRGSSVFDQPEQVRTARPGIYANRPTYRGNECGMRVARTLPEGRR